MACRGAAEDIISESWESLNECFPHPESSEKHCGAAKELSEIYWSALQQLFGIFGKASRNLGVLWETLRHCLATFWGLLAVLREKIIPIWMQDCAKNQPKLEIVCPEKTQQKHKYFSGFYNLFCFWGLGKL